MKRKKRIASKQFTNPCDAERQESEGAVSSLSSFTAAATGRQSLQLRERKGKEGAHTHTRAGAILTGSVLLGGLASFTRSKNPRSTQKWMRARVLAQGGTLAAMAGYVALHK